MSLLFVSSLLSLSPTGGAAGLPMALAGDFALRAGPGEVEVDGKLVRVPKAAALPVAPPEVVTVTDEAHDRLPFFNDKAAPWTKGANLRGVTTQETTAADMLVPDSVRVTLAKGDGQALAPDEDYGIDRRWGTFGRLEGGALGEATPVFVDYQYGVCRIDSVVVDAAGKVSLIAGKSHVNVPWPPEVPAGQTRVANVWVPGRLPKLTEANLFPILDDAYPEPPQPQPTPAERFVPKALAKLRSSAKLTILAWGDSVTVGTFVPNWQQNRWQEQFVTRLKERFPQANIELVTVARGGRNIQSFLNEPPGSQYNYKEQVLDRKPDLIVSEFVNDAYLDPAGVERMYGQRLTDFAGIGAEWIIQTPHYVRPDWMGLTSERDCDDDPRPYVKGLREFAAKHKVALADASLRWGHLWRQGIPCTTLLLNAINHPDRRGMKLFADALMALFP